MRFANVRELKINSNTILKKLVSEDVVITRQGKPVAAMVYLNEDLLDSFVLAHHPTLLDEINRDMAQWKKGKLRTVTLEDVRRRLGFRGTRSARPRKR